LHDRFGRSGLPTGRLWLAVAAAGISTVVLGGAVVLLLFASLFRDSCGEDWRWVALVVATGIAWLATLAALAVAGLSRHRNADGRGERCWATVVLVVTAGAWVLAVVSAWLPAGACP
jgi:hypothetical protein